MRIAQYSQEFLKRKIFNLSLYFIKTLDLRCLFPVSKLGYPNPIL